MRFLVDFHQDGISPLLVDEPPPVGEGAGPDAAHLLAAAVGNCLSASLVFCLQKARIEVGGLRTTAEVTKVRNEKGRLRIGRIDVKLEPEIAPEDRGRAARCLEIFEDYCVVTQSVRAGIDVNVEVVGVGEAPAATAA
jgi:organic hydroperoxide reductase OsmC/OhrA